MTFSTDLRLNEALGLAEGATPLDQVIKFARDRGVPLAALIAEIERRSTKPNPTDDVDLAAHEDPRVALTARTREIAAERGISFTDALVIAKRSNIELHERVAKMYDPNFGR